MLEEKLFQTTLKERIYYIFKWWEIQSQIEKLPIDGSFSNKCTYLLNIGLERYIEKYQKISDVETIKFIDLFAGLIGIRIGLKRHLKI